MTSFDPFGQLKFLRFFFIASALGGICPVSLIYSSISCNLCVFSLGKLGVEAVNNGNFPLPAE